MYIVYRKSFIYFLEFTINTAWYISGVCATMWICQLVQAYIHWQHFCQIMMTILLFWDLKFYCLAYFILYRTLKKRGLHYKLQEVDSEIIRPTGVPVRGPV